MSALSVNWSRPISYVVVGQDQAVPADDEAGAGGLRARRESRLGRRILGSLAARIARLAEEPFEQVVR
jgi:hypothetical protein